MTRGAVVSERQGWYGVALLSAAYILSYVDRTIIVLMVEPLKRDLGLTDTEVSLLIGFAFAVFFAIMGLPLGRLADRINRKSLVAIGIASWSVMTMLCGAARSFYALFLARVGVGVGEASLHPAAISLIGDYFHGAKRTRAMAIYMASGSFGAGGAFFIGAIALAATAQLPPRIDTWFGTFFSWQLAFIFVGAPGLLLALLVTLTMREPKRQDLIKMQVGKGLTLKEIGKFVGARRLTYIGLFGGCALGMLVALGAQAWLAALFSRRFGWSSSEAGIAIGAIVMTLGTLGPIIATLIINRLIKRGRKDAPLIVAGVITVVGPLMMAGAMLMPTPSLLLVLFAPAVSLLAALNAIPPLAVQMIAPNEMRAQLAAVYFFLVNIIGFAIGPMAVALLTDNVFGDEKSLHYSIALLGALAMPVATAFIFLGRASFRASIEDAAQWQGREIKS